MCDESGSLTKKNGCYCFIWVLHQKGHRNHLLAESDKFIIDDYPTAKLAEWKTYRQLLRDFDFSSYEIGDEIT